MDDAKFSKLENEHSVDLKFIKSTKKSSHASQMGRHRGEEASIDIAVRRGCGLWVWLL